MGINFENIKKYYGTVFGGSEPLILSYDKELDSFYILYQGFVLTREEFQELTAELNKTFRKYNNVIEATNNDILDRLNKKETPAPYDWRKPGSVYLCHKIDQQGYKIGLSTNVKKRMYQLNTTLVHSFPADNMAEAESSLHSKYQELNIKGEWFNLSHTDVNYILSISEYKNGQFIISGGERINTT